MVPGARTARTHGMALTVTLWLRFPSPALLFRRFHDICFSLHGSVGCVVSVSQGPSSPALHCPHHGCSVSPPWFVADMASLGWRRMSSGFPKRRKPAHAAMLLVGLSTSLVVFFVGKLPDETAARLH